MKHFNLLKQLLLIPLLVLAAGVAALAQPLNGVYTIGGTSPNYATLAAAVADLNTKGVSGKVWFNIRTGTYSSNTNWVADISGTYVGATDPNNRVTFQSESGNKADVTISNANTSTVNYIFRLNGAQHVTVRNMTLASTDATNSRLIDIVGSATKDSVYNCNLTALATTSTSTSAALVHGNGYTGNDNVIFNNVITNGGYGVYLFGSSTTYPQRTIVANNTMTEQYWYGSYFYYQKDLSVTGNTITKANNTTSYNGIYLYYCSDAMRVNSNTITLTGTSSTHYGIYAQYCQGSSSNSMLRGTINNNTVTMTTSSGWQYHVYITNYSNYITMSGNTLTGTSTSTSCYMYPIYNSNYSQFNTITGNTVTGTNAGYTYNYPAYNYCHNTTFTNNTLNLTSTSFLPMYAMHYAGYYSNNGVYTGNTLNLTGNSSGAIYGWNYCASNYSDNNNISNNTTNIGGTGTGTIYGWNYCMYWYANGNTFNNNTTTITRSSSGTIYPYYYCIYYYANNNAITNTTTTVTNTGTAQTYGFWQPISYYCQNSTMTGNKLTQTGRSTMYGMYYPGTYYVSGVNISNNEITNTTTSGTNYGAFYPGYYFNYNFYYGTNPQPFNFNNNKITCSTATSTCYGVYFLGYYGYGDVNFNGNTVSTTCGSTNYAVYIYPWYGLKTNAHNNTITATNTGSGTTYGMYIYSWYVNSSYDNSIYATGNNITASTGNGTAYGLYTYRYFFPQYTLGRTVINNNTVRTTAATTSSWIQSAGIYASLGYGVNDTMNNNDVQARNTAGTVYGIYSQQHNGGEVKNNAVSSISTGTTSYTMYCYFPTGDTKYTNNTFSNNGSNASSKALYVFQYPGSSSLPNTSIWRNNIFANTRVSSPPVLFYTWEPGANSDMDYNNFYANSTSPTYAVTQVSSWWNVNNSGSRTLQAWRNLTGGDFGSLAYNPGFTDSMTNLRPNPARPESWASNGRGVHDASNNKDILGNARVTTRPAGVPDLGAYEFTPTSVPPLAYTASPTPTAGTTSLYLFGQDTVMSIDWPATGSIPTAFAVRQYTGVIPPGIGALGSTNMYFYVDAQPTGSAPFTSDTRIYYKDPWTGSTAETALRMAQKDGTNPWIAHPHTSSGSNATRNFIYKTGLTNFGLLTGADIANNAGVLEIVTPKPLFCAGTYTLTAKIGNLGNNTITNVQIGWSVDGVLQTPLNYTTPIPTAAAGNSTPIVTLGSITFGNKLKQIKIWTSMPNNTVDPVPTDDTINLRWGPGLSGEYTIGGTNPDWPTLTAALADMKVFGVCGPVWFNMRAGTYTGQYRLENAMGMSAINRVTIQSESKVAADVQLTATGTVFDFANNASNFTLNKITANMTGTSQVININSGNTRDSINGCVLNAPTGGFAYVIRMNQPSVTIDRFSVTNSTLSGGGYGIYGYLYQGNALNQQGMSNSVFDNNRFENQRFYPIYFYYAGTPKIRYNDMTTTYAASYGIFVGYCQGADILNNKVSFTTDISSWGAGIYLSDFSNTAAKPYNVRNNVIAMAGSTSFQSGYGGLAIYAPYSNVHNNSISISAPGGAALVVSASNAGLDIKNNVAAHYGGGNALNVTSSPGASLALDYNNYYTNGASLVGGAVTADTLTRWRILSGKDMNSISYDPGFTSIMNPTPDVNNPASWSLNGRGVHIPDNDSDFNANARVVNRADGVPDIGAYEFTPQTIPPVAKAIPSTPVAGGTQVFTFGQDTVARIMWDANTYVPSTVAVRQWTGTVPPQFPVNNHMYFYTDIDATAVTYISDVDVYYKNPWTGKIPAAQEANIRMIRKEAPSKPWSAYNGTSSITDTGRNRMTGPTLTGLGYFTGVQNDSVISVNIKPMSRVVFCPGGSVTMQSGFSSNGYTHQWMFNNNNIPGAILPSYTATMSGDYSVRVTDTATSRTITSNAVAVTIVSSPAAVVTANGPTTICTGNNVTLNVGTGSGLTYQWRLNGNDIAGANAPSYLVTSGGEYSVVVKNIGCADVSPDLKIVQGPVSVNLGNDTSFCTASPLHLDALNPGARYRWSTGDTNQTLTISSYGKHTIAVHVDAGVNCIAKDTIEVEISPMPEVVGISSIRQFGNTYKFSPAGSKYVESYLWIFGDGSTDTTSNIMHEYNGGVFKLKLVVFNGCGSDTTELELPLTVSDVTNRSDFELYPNPAKSNITLKVYGEAQFNDIAIVNSIGQIVMREPGTNTKSRTFDIRMLPDGHYFIRASTADGKVISKPFRVLR